MLHRLKNTAADVLCHESDGNDAGPIVCASLLREVTAPLQALDDRRQIELSGLGDPGSCAPVPGRASPGNLSCHELKDSFMR